MADPTVKMQFTGDPKSAERALASLEKKYDKLENKIRQTNKVSHKGAKSSKESAGAIRGMTAAIVHDAAALAGAAHDLAGVLEEETLALAAMDTAAVARLAPAKTRLCAEYERLAGPVLDSGARSLAGPEREHVAEAVACLRRAVGANERALAAATAANARLLKAVAAGVHGQAAEAAGYTNQGDRAGAKALRPAPVRLDQTL